MSPYRIVGRTTPVCRFCVRAKDELRVRRLDYTWEEINAAQHKAEFEALGLVGDKLTVPQIWGPDGTHIGGFDDLRAHLG